MQIFNRFWNPMFLADFSFFDALSKINRVWIKKLVIKGFESYKDETIEEFDKEVNVFGKLIIFI